jgi:hypothetical protein
VTHELPYTPAYGKIGTLFERIAKAKVPDALTVKVLSQSLGLTSTNDRSLIPLLRKLGFLDGSGKPTAEYGKLKNQTSASAAIAQGIKRAYEPLYEANEQAQELSPEELKGLIAQVSGAEETLIKFIAGTLNALIKVADFSKAAPEKPAPEKEEVAMKGDNGGDGNKPPKLTHFNPDFKFNIEIHLPSTGTEETYLAIFNALRRSLG